MRTVPYAILAYMIFALIGVYGWALMVDGNQWLGGILAAFAVIEAASFTFFLWALKYSCYVCQD